MLTGQLYLNGIGNGAAYAGNYASGTGIEGACANWTNAATWTPAIKAEYQTLFNAWTDAGSSSPCAASLTPLYCSTASTGRA